MKRDDHTGYIYQDGGKWHCRVKKDGKSHHYVGKTKTEVKAKRDALFEDFPAGYETFCVIALKMLSAQRLQLKPSSYTRKVSTLTSHVFPVIGDRLICSVKREDIQALITDKAESMSYSSVKKIYNAIDSVYKFYSLDNAVKNPCRGVILPAADKRGNEDIYVYSADEIKRLEANADKVRLGKAIMLMLYTGLREGELCGLQWRDVSGNLLHVRRSVSYVSVDGRYEWICSTPKTGAGTRIVPLPDKAVKILAELPRTSEYIFTTAKQPRINPQLLIDAFNALKRIADIQPIIDDSGKHSRTIHHLRHTYASLLFDRGVPVKVVSQLLGHSSTAITERVYISILEKQRAAAVNNINSIFG